MTDITQDIREIEQKIAQPKKSAEPPFIEKTRDEIKLLTPVQRLEYQEAYLKNQLKLTQQKIKNAIKTGEAEPRKIETRKAILWGKMIAKELEGNPERRVQYEAIKSHLERYLTKNRDRELFGFAPLVDDNE